MLAVWAGSNQLSTPLPVGDEGRALGGIAERRAASLVVERWRASRRCTAAAADAEAQLDRQSLFRWLQIPGLMEATTAGRGQGGGAHILTSIAQNCRRGRRCSIRSARAQSRTSIWSQEKLLERTSR